MCTDKTGTLTEASLRVVELIPAAGGTEADLAETFGTYAASAPTEHDPGGDPCGGPGRRGAAARRRGAG